MEGTEYGGMIDKIRVVTDEGNLVYMGRTWHGIIESKVIEPDVGQDYLVLNGEANQCLQQIINRCGLGALFSADPESSGLMIRNYQMNRYITAYSGIRKMLESINAKLKITFSEGFCKLSAVPIVDYSHDDEFDSSQIAFDVTKNFHQVNHCICLGKGELQERTVIHLYMDSFGNISHTQTLFGLDEITGIFENVNAESDEELEQGGIDYLKESWQSDELYVDFDSSKNYDIDDIVGARENVTGIFIAKPITKKIVTIKDTLVVVQYKVGED